MIERPTVTPEMLWPIGSQYPGLVIPETWDTLDEFVRWYMANGKPMLVPWDAVTIRTDDATAICIFRKGQFQVELYIIHPKQVIPIHAHPGMEVITVTMGGGSVCGGRGDEYDISRNCGLTSFLPEGEVHGGKPTGNGDGFVLLSFERWLRGVQPTSAALQWKGPTAGPVHDALIQSQYNPNQYQPIPGQFDVSPFTPQVES